MSGIHFSSLTTIASKLAPTGARVRFEDQIGSKAASLSPSTPPLTVPTITITEGRCANITHAISIASYGTIIGCVSAGSGAALVPRGIYEQYRQGANWQGQVFAELKRIDNRFYWHANAGCHPARDAFSALLQGHCLHGATSNEA